MGARYNPGPVRMKEPDSSGPQRVQKLVAAAGLGSRRAVERWIHEGRITVNGAVAKLGDRATLGDVVCLDGKPLDLAGGRATGRRVLLYHKPIGEVTTRSDPQRRPTVFERLPKVESGRWIAVGRLDVMTSGLLLFTTDGELAHRLMHPSNEVEREYLAQVHGNPTKETLDRLLDGVELDDGPARFDSVKVEQCNESGCSIRVILHEGRNREVRRMWSAVGHEVVRLARVRYGSLRLPADLPAGSWRDAPAEAVESLL
jgi:23S rRNA pseudouridine2605 synthase